MLGRLGQRALVFWCALFLAACGRDEPIQASDSASFEFKTEPFSVPAGQEKFLCYAKTLQQNLVVDRFDYQANPVIHHLLLSRTLAPEPEGFSECDVLFRATWQIMFGATTSDTSLELPSGAAAVLPKGTQILAQLHLLNASAESVTDSFSISLHRSLLADPVPTGLYVFGKTDLSLPPKQTTTIEHECTLPEDVTMFGAIPHMHYLGRALRFDTGASTGTLKRSYQRDPYDFDDQRLDPLNLTLKQGSRAKVSCDFDNASDKTISFGESSKEEMCFLVTFAVGREGADGCGSVPASDAGLVDSGVACGSQPPNSLGIGKPCTKAGKECPSGLTCTLDQASTPPDSPGFCFKLCETTDQCGDGEVTCCAPKQAGGLVKTCLPKACQPTDCL